MAAAVTNCPTCGVGVDAEQTSCHNCSTPLSPTRTAAATPTVREARRAKNGSSDRTVPGALRPAPSTGRYALIGAGCGAIAAVAIAIVLSLGRSDSDSGPTSVPTSPTDSSAPSRATDTSAPTETDQPGRRGPSTVPADTTVVTGAGAVLFEPDKAVIGVIYDANTQRSADVADAVRLGAASLADEGSPGIRVEACDDGGNPDSAAECASRLARDPQLVAIVGPTTSPAADAVIRVIEPLGVPVLIVGATRADLTRDLAADATRRAHATTYRLTASDYGLGAAAANRAATPANSQGRKAIVVTGDGPAALGRQRGFTETFEALGGTVTTASAESVGDVAAGTDTVFFAADDAGAASGVLETLAQSGFRGTFLGADQLFGDSFTATRCSATLRCFGFDAGAPLNRKSAFFIRFRAQHGRDPTEWSAYGYDAFRSLADRTKRASVREIDVERLRSVLVTSLDTAPTNGVTGEIAFDAYGDTSAKAYVSYRNLGRGWTVAP